jgi:hypothetical protein
MTLRPPRSLRPRSPEPSENPLGYEIAREQASALGRLGRTLEQTLAALAAFDAGAHPAPAAGARAELVRQASNALWCFIVQREACGLRDPRPVLRDYRVPAEVHLRMGAFVPILRR